MSSKHLIHNVLATGGFWMVNIALAKKIGHLEALLLAELIYQEKEAGHAGNIPEDGFFPVTMEVLQERTAISIRSQKRYVSKLERSFCIKTDLRGIPRQKFYQIQHEYIEAVLKMPETRQSAHKGQFGPYGEAKLASHARPKSPDKPGQFGLAIHYSKNKEKKNRSGQAQLSLNGFWPKVLGCLQKRINTPSFNTWLRPTQGELRDNLCLVSVPDDVFEFHLSENYTHVLREVVLEISQKENVEVQYIISNSS